MKKHTAIKWDENNPLPPLQREIMQASHDLAKGIMSTLVDARESASDEIKDEWASVIANTLIRCVDICCKLAPDGYKTDTMDGIVGTLEAIKGSYKDGE